MVQAAEPGHGDDCTGSADVPRLPAGGRLFAEPEVGPVFMVVAHIFVHQPLQMGFVHHDDMIDQVAAAAGDESLGNSVLPGASNRDSNQGDAQTLRRFQNSIMERVLAIEDEKPRRGVVRKGIPQLLRYPCAAWIPSDVAVKNATPMRSDHEKTIQHAEPERRHSEEVHGGDRIAVIAEERRPSSCRPGISRGLPHPAQDCPLRDIEAEHLQLAVDTRRTLGAILGHPAKDQLPQLSARGLPSDNGMFA